MNPISSFRLLAICGVFFLSIIASTVTVIASSRPLPEDFKTAITMQPEVTRIIKEDDIALALTILNKMHSTMAEEGWKLYQIIEFVDNGDFEGFFVTYKKQK